VDDLPDLEGLSVYDERLRAVAGDPAPVERAAQSAEAALLEARGRVDVRAEIRLLGYLGNARRMLGDVDGAVACLRRSLGLAESGGFERAAVVALIRLGEAHRCADEFARAEEVIAAALARAPRDLRDFALQHLGKCLLDAGHVERAEAVLEEALALRREKGDAELIRSTAAALARARALATP
jgi:HTH-type transcriptional regulator, pleiotropic regulator of extracellular virulence genes